MLGIDGRRVGRVHVCSQQFRVIVQHLFEVWHDPLRVHGVPMETATKMIAHAASTHGVERSQHDRRKRRLSGVEPAGQEEIARSWVRKLRLRAEPAVPCIGESCHAFGGLREDRGTDRAREGLRLVHRQMPRDLDGLLPSVLRTLSVEPRETGQDGLKSRTPVSTVGREVRASVEHRAFRRQECGKWPATLTRQELNRTLVAGIDVGPLVPVHLDADPVAVEHPGDRGILVRLMIHHMTPMTPHRSDIEQDRLVFVPGPLEGLVAPGMPLDRLILGGAEVGGLLIGEVIGHRCPQSAGGAGRGQSLPRSATAARLSNSTATGNASSSRSNRGE